MPLGKDPVPDADERAWLDAQKRQRVRDFKTKMVNQVTGRSGGYWPPPNLRRPDVAAMLANLRPGQFISRDAKGPYVRRGVPMDPFDIARFTRKAESAGECPDCGRDRWVLAEFEHEPALTSRGRIGSAAEILWRVCQPCGYREEVSRFEPQSDAPDDDNGLVYDEHQGSVRDAQ